jgi:hypothetical protein
LRCIGTCHDPGIVLMKLIVEHRVIEKISKIIEQIEFASDGVGIGFP